ncbi:MAG TPA: M23 family metallopeptidase [Candidatus Methylomirabilis sp.]|nr:M23 family metallopeptidase [Candidatus Methylomirabilis sp.]
MVPHNAPENPTQPNARPRRSCNWLLLAGVGLVIVVSALSLTLRWDRRARVPATPPPAPPSTHLLEKGRTFAHALSARGIHQTVAAEIIQAFRPHLDFRRLRAGDALELHRDAQGQLVRVVYRQSPVDIVEAWRDGEAWTASRRDVPIEHRVVTVAGKLEGNLFESMESLGEQAQLVLDFAEIFAWDFDFASDSQPGDRFRMLVEKVYTGEQFVKYGRILAAEYESEGTTHTGIYFRDKEGGGYYTPAGESLRRAFLKSPLEFTRISSRYSYGRRHPILGGVRPHLAVDYTAPHGTPVWAVAVGTVEFAGRKGGNGNTVILRHRSNFKTMYNHLSRFGKGIRGGAKVTQRQVIGYVGSTGLSTGPHLDYRVIKDGRFVNPLKETFLPGKSISPPSRPAFNDARDSLLGQLRSSLVAKTGEPPAS